MKKNRLPPEFRLVNCGASLTHSHHSGHDESSSDLEDDFMFRHSAALELFKITDHVTFASARNQTIVMVSLDLEKAFDKIRNERLVSKIKVAGFQTRILQTIRLNLYPKYYTVVSSASMFPTLSNRLTTNCSMPSV